MEKLFWIDGKTSAPELLREAARQVFPEASWEEYYSEQEGYSAALKEGPLVVFLGVNQEGPQSDKGSVPSFPAEASGFIPVVRYGKPDPETHLPHAPDPGVDMALPADCSLGEILQLLKFIARTRQAGLNVEKQKQRMEMELEIQTMAFRNQIEELRTVESERRASVLSLEKIKRAALNLMEDLREEVEQRKQSELVLQESEHRYEVFINSVDDFVFLKDESFRYLFINKANADFFDRKAEEIIGHDDFEFLSFEHAAACRQADLAALQDNRIVIREEEVGGRIFETRKFPVRLRDGKTGVGGYIRDISDRKAAEAEIKKLHESLEHRVKERTAQLEDANRELEAFSYSVSHDLRAPLRAVDGFTQILLEDYGARLDEEGRMLCKVVKENATRMSHLIDDLLSLSRLNRAAMRYTRIRMGAFASAVFSEISTESDRERIRFTSHASHEIAADPILIKQVLVNLISNAIKFTSKKDRAEIAFFSEMNENSIVFCLKDDGAGFDMHYIDKLFCAFQRLHSAREFEGNGIGLAIVQRIVHRHGGKVWAEGAVGKGASFYFSLPLENPEN